MSTAATSNEVDQLGREISELEARLEEFGSAGIKARIAKLNRELTEAAAKEKKREYDALAELGVAENRLVAAAAAADEVLRNAPPVFEEAEAARTAYEAALRRARALGIADLVHVPKLGERANRDSELLRVVRRWREATALADY